MIQTSSGHFFNKQIDRCCPPHKVIFHQGSVSDHTSQENLRKLNESHMKPSSNGLCYTLIKNLSSSITQCSSLTPQHGWLSWFSCSSWMLTETLPEGNLRAILIREATSEKPTHEMIMTVIFRWVELAGENGLTEGVADVKSEVVKISTEVEA